MLMEYNKILPFATHKGSNNALFKYELQAFLHSFSYMAITNDNSE